MEVKLQYLKLSYMPNDLVSEFENLFYSKIVKNLWDMLKEKSKQALWTKM